MYLDTNSLLYKKVYLHKPNKRDPDHVKKAGRIKAFVFHPKRARLVGYIVKQPDVAWMFRRADLFVARDGLAQFEDTLVITDNPSAFGKGAERALAKTEGVSVDECVLWLGLAVVSETGQMLGVVDSVEFDSDTGDVASVKLSQGATANTLLGSRVVPAKDLRGFKPAADVAPSCADADEGVTRDATFVGALVVSADAANANLTGGVAEKAGAASAVAIDKAKRVYKKVASKAQPATAKIAPAAKKASKAAGQAVEKGAFATGRQLVRGEHMFASFLEEFKKSSK